MARGLGDERTRAVPADVVERAQRPVVLPDDEDAPARELVRRVVAGFSELRAERRQLPLPHEDVHPFRRVEVRIDVRTARAVCWSRARGYAPVTAQLPMTWAFIFWYSSSLEDALGLEVGELAQLVGGTRAADGVLDVRAGGGVGGLGLFHRMLVHLVARAIR